MAKNAPLNGWTRLVIYVVVIAAAACIVWGSVRHQVVDSAEDIIEIKTVIIPAKLDKEVFRMYLEQEEKADVRRDKVLDDQFDKIDKKLDKALEK